MNLQILAINERAGQYPSRYCLTLTRVYELGLRHFDFEVEGELEGAAAGSMLLHCLPSPTMHSHLGNPLSHRGLRDHTSVCTNKNTSEGA
eukprot:scaffold7615_cov86-Skeletonema_dohrnii-CCMP3373.AAC.7